MTHRLLLQPSSPQYFWQRGFINWRCLLGRLRLDIRGLVYYQKDYTLSANVFLYFFLLILAELLNSRRSESGASSTASSITGLSAVSLSLGEAAKLGQPWLISGWTEKRGSGGASCWQSRQTARFHTPLPEFMAERPHRMTLDPVCQEPGIGGMRHVSASRSFCMQWGKQGF